MICILGQGDIKFQKLSINDNVHLKAPTNLNYVTDDMLWELRDAKSSGDDEQSWYITDDEQGLQLAIIESCELNHPLSLSHSSDSAIVELNTTSCKLSLATNETVADNAKWIITEMVKRNATNPAEYRIQNKMYPDYYLVQITHGEESFSVGISNDVQMENISNHWRIETQFTEPETEWVEIMNFDNTDGLMSFQQTVTLKSGVTSDTTNASTESNMVCFEFMCPIAQ